MRLFFALCPPPAVTNSLASLAQRLCDGFGGKATRAETVHLTLLFLGEQPEERLLPLQEAAARVCVAPFLLTLDHLGYWPHNRLLWAGCRQPSPAHETLTRLATDLRRQITASGIEFANDTPSFVPHVTLVRKVAQLPHGGALPSLPPIAWPCSEFALVHSQLGAGPVHQTIATFTLRAD